VFVGHLGPDEGVVAAVVPAFDEGVLSKDTRRIA
jgi:hypothetical protein